MTKICPNCKTGNSDDATFCQNCGKDVSQTSRATQRTVTPNSGATAWWGKQSKRNKTAIGIGGVCCIGLIIIIAIFGMFSPNQTSSTTAPATNVSNTPTTTQQSSNSNQQPVSFSGTGEQTTQQFHWNGGAARFNLTYSGDGNFIVDVLDSSGNIASPGIANAIGSYTGSRVVNLPSGDYMLDISAADGPWTITVSPG